MDIDSVTIIDVFKRKSTKPIPTIKLIWKDITGKIQSLTQYPRCPKHD